ncbi:MAG: hypothetical protein QXI09_01405 [Candidatus Aenigmatarchaeota archaeon]
MKEKIEIVIKDGYCLILFRGSCYRIDCLYLDKILEKIENIKKKHREIQKNLIREAASLGVIPILITTGGKNLLEEEFYREIEKVLKRYSKDRNRTLEEYLK